jgi:hypothetical protein
MSRLVVTLLPVGMRLVGVHRLVDPGDRHRALALTVELIELGAEQLQRTLEIGEVHGRTAEDDGLEPARIGRACRRMVDEARDHGRSGEHAQVGVGCQGVEHTFRFERACRDHIASAARDVREAVQPRPVRERCRVQDRILRVDPVDVGIVAVAGEQDVAVAEDGPLGPSCRAAGVE